MKKLLSHRLLLVMLISFASFRSFACLNEEETALYTKTDGSYVNHYPSHSYKFYHGFDKDHLKEEKEKVELELKEHPDSYELNSTYGIILVKLGETNKALKIFQKLLAQRPNEYSVNANLGTTYELSGNNKLALKYIQNAVKINPNSHNGSEWIHVEILKAKIKAEAQPSYLSSNSILKLNLDIHRSYSEAELQRYRKMKEELEWQLKERISFVDAPDAVVANLLFDLANLIAVTEVLEASLPVYNEAMRYGTNAKKIQSRKDEVNSIIFETKLRKYLLVLGAVLLVLSGVFLLVRWAMFGKKRKEAKVFYN